MSSIINIFLASTPRGTCEHSVFTLLRTSFVNYFSIHYDNLLRFHYFWIPSRSSVIEWIFGDKTGVLRKKCLFGIWFCVKLSWTLKLVYLANSSVKDNIRVSTFTLNSIDFKFKGKHCYKTRWVDIVDKCLSKMFFIVLSQSILALNLKFVEKKPQKSSITFNLYSSTGPNYKTSFGQHRGNASVQKSGESPLSSHPPIRHHVPCRLNRAQRGCRKLYIRHCQVRSFKHTGRFLVVIEL